MVFERQAAGPVFSNKSGYCFYPACLLEEGSQIHMEGR